MAGQDPMVALNRIQSAHSSIDVSEIRFRTLQLAMGARIDTAAEYVFVTGCKGLSAYFPIAYLVKLLEHFKVDYTFLSVETCCGNAILDHLDSKDRSEEAMALEEHARSF